MSATMLRDNWQEQLRALPENWDSYKAPPITELAIGTLESFAAVPCNDGGIQLEVHRDGYDIEVCISPAGKITGVLVCLEPKESA